MPKQRPISEDSMYNMTAGLKPDDPGVEAGRVDAEESGTQGTRSSQCAQFLCCWLSRRLRRRLVV